MPNIWLKTQTTKGSQFEQWIEDVEGRHKNIGNIYRVVCKTHLQNELHLYFSSASVRTLFIQALEKANIPARVKTLSDSNSLQIVFSANIKVLNGLLKVLHSIDPLTVQLDENILSVFSLNKIDYLESVIQKLEERVSLLKRAQTQVTKQIPESFERQEYVAEFLEHFPKETIGKLTAENAKLEQFLSSTPQERASPARVSPTVLVQFCSSKVVKAVEPEAQVATVAPIPKRKPLLHTLLPVPLTPETVLETDVKLTEELMKMGGLTHITHSESGQEIAIDTATDTHGQNTGDIDIKGDVDIEIDTLEGILDGDSSPARDILSFLKENNARSQGNSSRRYS